jgi:hypothetical protein
VVWSVFLVNTSSVPFQRIRVQLHSGVVLLLLYAPMHHQSHLINDTCTEYTPKPFISYKDDTVKQFQCKVCFYVFVFSNWCCHIVWCFRLNLTAILINFSGDFISKTKKMKRQTMVNKTLRRKLNIEQHEPRLSVKLEWSTLHIKSKC